jgi:hypothetical protein
MTALAILCLPDLAIIAAIVVLLTRDICRGTTNWS